MSIVTESGLVPQAPPDDSVWTPEREMLLRALWADGLSATQIGIRTGFTRNAIISKVRRLGLPYRDPRKIRTSRADVLPVSAGVGIIFGSFRSSDDFFCRLCRPPRRLCCWPEGDPRLPAFHFCAQPVKSGSRYCPHHHKRAYIGFGKIRKRKCQDGTSSKAQPAKHPKTARAPASGAKTTPETRRPSPSRP